MNKLTPKTSNFAAGRKLFMKRGGELEVSESETLPEGFSLGVEVPEENGIYTVTTSFGAFVISVNAEEIIVTPWLSTSGTGNDYVFNSVYDNRLTQKAGLLPVILPLDVALLDESGYTDSPLSDLWSYWESPTHATHFEAGDLFVFYSGAFAVNKNTYELAWIFSEEATWNGRTYNAFPKLDRSYGAANSAGNEEYYVGISSYDVLGLYVLKTQTGEAIYREPDLDSFTYVNEGVNVYPSGRNNKFFLWDGGRWNAEATPQVYILEIDALDNVTITLHPENATMSSGGDYLMEPRLFMAAKSFFVDKDTGEYYYSSGYTLTKFNADDSVAWYLDYNDDDWLQLSWFPDGWNAFCIKRKGKIIVFTRSTIPLLVDDATGEWEIAQLDETAMVTGETPGFIDFLLTDFWGNGYDLEMPRVVSDSIDYLPVLNEFTINPNKFVEFYVVDLDTFNVREVGLLPGEGDAVFYNQTGWPIINHSTGVSYIRIFNRNAGGDGLYRLIGWSNNGIVSNIALSYWNHSGTTGFYIEEHTPSLMLVESGDLLVHIDSCIAKYSDEVWTLNVGQTAQLSAGEWYRTKNTTWSPGVPLYAVGVSTNTAVNPVYGEINSKYFPYSVRTIADTDTGEGYFNIAQFPGYNATTAADMSTLFPTGVPDEYLSTSYSSGTVTSAVIRRINFETASVEDFSLPNITTGLTSQYLRQTAVQRPNGNIVFVYQRIQNSTALESRPFEYDGVSWSAKAFTSYAASENDSNVPIGNSGYRRFITVYHNDKLYSMLFKRVVEEDFHVREYDFTLNTWSDYDSIPVPEVPGNRLSVSSGYRQGKVYFTNGYVYDIELKSLTKLPNFPFPDNSSARHITFRNNCVIFLAGDLDFYVYALENTPAPY